MQAFRKAVVFGEKDSTGAKVLETYNFLVNTVVLRKGKAAERYQDALDLWDQAIQAYPKYPHPYGWKGTVLYKVGRLEEATVMLELAVRSNVKEPEMYHHLGLCYVRQNRKMEAKEMFSRALQLDTKHSAAATELAKLR